MYCMENLREYIRQYTQVDEKQLEFWLSKFHKRGYVPKEEILNQGARCNYYYFVEEGAIRIYFYKDHREISAWLATEKTFFTELESFNSQQPSKYVIEAVNDSIIFRIGRMDFDELMNTSVAWNRLILRVWQEAFIKTTHAIVSFQADFADERYDQLTQDSNIIQKVPQKLIASFLGITPTSLSRIRKRNTS